MNGDSRPVRSAPSGGTAADRPLDAEQRDWSVMLFVVLLLVAPIAASFAVR